MTDPIQAMRKAGQDFLNKENEYIGTDYIHDANGYYRAMYDATIAAYQQAAPAPIPAGYHELLEAAKEFVRKVEAGEAKSKRSYAAFKSAIAKAAPTPGAENELG